MFKMVALGALALSAAASAQVLSFRADINGLQAGTDSPAFGVLTGDLDVDAGTFEWVYQITSIGPYSLIGDPAEPGAHFHRQVPGLLTGPIIEEISPGPWSLNDAGLWTGISETEAQALIAGEIYVDFHTDAFPDGEIRGQVLLIPAPGTAGVLAGVGLLAAGRRRR